MITEKSTAWLNYVETALWSSVDDQGYPLDAIYDMCDVVFNPKVAAELEDFYSKAKDLLSNEDKAQCWEHDFWLTRNGHGSGFWDGNYLNGDQLTALAKKYGESYLYVGDDGKIYFS